jgi:hypothetical protein
VERKAKRQSRSQLGKGNGEKEIKEKEEALDGL